MRIAYCFSGYLRTFDMNDTLLKNIIEVNGGDVFIHTWNRMNYSGKAWHDDKGLSDQEVTDEVIDKLKKMYDPKRIVIEDEDFNRFEQSIMPYSMAKYSVMMSNYFRKEYEVLNYVKYDWIVQLRFDLKIYDRYLFKNKNPDKLYTLFNYRTSKDHACDILNHSSGEIIDVVSDLCYYMVDNKKEAAINMSPEYWLKQWTNLNNIIVEPVKLNASLLRSDMSELYI